MTVTGTKETSTIRLGRDYGDRGRFGVVIPSNNLVLEPELYATVRPGVTGHFARIPASSMAPEAYDAMIEHLDGAVSQLAQAGVDAILYACLSTSLVQPAGWDAEFVASVRAATGLPAVTAAQSVVASIQASQTSTVAVVSPYPHHIDALVAEYLSRSGIRVVHSASLDVADVNEVGNIDPARLLELTLRMPTSDAGALVVLATDLRTMDVIDEIQERLGLPMISTNSALLHAGYGLLGSERTNRGASVTQSRIQGSAS